MNRPQRVGRVASNIKLNAVLNGKKITHFQDFNIQLLAKVQVVTDKPKIPPNLLASYMVSDTYLRSFETN